MRRFLTTLMILLVVLVAGMSALVMLVNPNDFRKYMVQEVEQRSGYQLQLDGSLRWHVWPRLSILSGRMSLKAPGAERPVVSAENMRLDVALWPLLSHQLKVNQVLLKRAVIELTPQSEARRPQGAPQQPGDTNNAPIDLGRGWSFDINNLDVTDSLLVFQHGDDEQITVRDIDMKMTQDAFHKGQLTLSSRINRDQRDLTFSLEAELDASHYPHVLGANLTALSYQFQGADLPPQGIRGQGTMQLEWQADAKKIAIGNLGLTANDSTINGSMSMMLSDVSQWQVALTSPRLNLDNLLINRDPASQKAQKGAVQHQGPQAIPRPVISGGAEQLPVSVLRTFAGDIALDAQEVIWRGLTFNDVALQATNKDALLTINKLEGRSGEGTMSLPGSIDARESVQRVAVTPKINGLEIGPILKAFNYPLLLSGKISLNGDFTGSSFDSQDFRENWQGNAQLTMKDSRMEGMNFQQLIQQAVSRNHSDVQTQRNYDDATVLSSFSAESTLDHGVLTMRNMIGESKVMTLTGSGMMDLNKEICDSSFNVMVTGGWEGDGQLVELLKRTPIPLRVYGPWQRLSYSLQVDQVLRKQLQDDAKQRLRNWADRNKDSSKSKELKQLLDKL